MLRRELEHLVRNGMKIHLIKEHRRVTGSSLIDAKNFVEDSLMSRDPRPSPSLCAGSGRAYAG